MKKNYTTLNILSSGTHYTANINPKFATSEIKSFLKNNFDELPNNFKLQPESTYPADDNYTTIINYRINPGLESHKTIILTTWFGDSYDDYGYPTTPTTEHRIYLY